jgi:Protein of unknown function (DUF1565)
MRLIPRPGHAALPAAVTLAAIVTAACGQHVGATSLSGADLGRALPSRLAGTSGKHVFFVDGRRGSDRNRGSRRAPWKTMVKALATVPLSGSVIKVMPGTYTSEGTRYAIAFNRKGDVRDPVTIEPAIPGTVTVENGALDTATLGAWVVHATGLRIRGMRFKVLTRPGANISAGAILVEDSDRIEIVGCTFNEVSASGLLVRGGAGSTADDVWVIDNTFRPTGPNLTKQVTGLGYGSDQYFGSKGSHWIYAGQYGDERTWEQLSGTRRLVVVNNVFVGSTAGRDIQLGPQARQSFVVNNTFYGNRSADVIGRSTQAVYAGQAVELFSNSSNPAYITGFNTIANNLFLNLQGPAVSGSGPAEPGNTVMNNLSWQVTKGGAEAGDSGDFAPTNGGERIFSLGGQNRRIAPRLIDPSHYDFRLRLGSPALRRAAPRFSYAFSAGGALRPAAPAIGAFERACAGSSRSKAKARTC